MSGRALIALVASGCVLMFAVLYVVEQVHDQRNEHHCAGLFALAATRADSMHVAVEERCAWYLGAELAERP